MCRVCGGPTSFRWSALVLGGRYRADYVECNVCGSLQIRDPFWLAEAYAHEATPRSTDTLDPGRFRRNFSAYAYLVALHRAGLILGASSFLDYGGGYALLTQMLTDAGYDAWTYDIHVPQPPFAPDRVVANLEGIPDRSYDVVLALEVFEHLIDPMAVADELRRIVKEGGLLVISTEIYDASTHQSDWPYLACEGGQHITLWSSRALHILASRLRFRSIGFFPGGKGFLIVLSALPPVVMRKRLMDAAVLLQSANFWRDAVSRWDFRNVGVVEHLISPPVEDIEA